MFLATLTKHLNNRNRKNKKINKQNENQSENFINFNRISLVFIFLCPTMKYEIFISLSNI